MALLPVMFATGGGLLLIVVSRWFEPALYSVPVVSAALVPFWNWAVPHIELRVARARVRRRFVPILGLVSAEKRIQLQPSLNEALKHFSVRPEPEQRSAAEPTALDSKPPQWSGIQGLKESRRAPLGSDVTSQPMEGEHGSEADARSADRNSPAAPPVSDSENSPSSSDVRELAGSDENRRERQRKN